MATRAETPNLESSNSYQRENGSTPGNIMGMDPKRVAQGLGWFSIGLGLAEIFAPRAVSRIVGANNHSNLVRFYGMREVLAGVGILTQPNPAPWLWGRVAGDVLDLSTLGKTLNGPENNRALAALGIASVGVVTALDYLCAKELSEQHAQHGNPAMHAEANMMINRSPEECYNVWRNFENLPHFMQYLQSVRLTGGRQSHWVGNVPGGATIEWDAEMTEDRPNERIGWRSLPGSQVTNSGTVDFEKAPGGRGTIVRVQMDYNAPGASVASLLAKMIGKEPEQLVNKDLRRFKQYIETGSVITTDGQPAGRRSGTTWLDSVAR